MNETLRREAEKLVEEDLAWLTSFLMKKPFNMKTSEVRRLIREKLVDVV